MMKHSPIEGIREQSDRLLDGYVRRASIDNMTWWRRVWLPQYIQDVAESDVPRMFELAGYDLQSVEALLHRAPEGLSYLYEANPERFAYHLYYSTLSRDVYTRLLTLIAVREYYRIVPIPKGGTASNDVEDDENEKDEAELVTKLKPIFYNHEENVHRFLKEISGMATEDITDLVNRWVEDKLISDYGNSRKGVLWGILHKAKLYSKSRSNWNGRVK